MASGKKVAVRVLADIQVGSKSYKANQVVGFTSRIAAGLVKAGNADDDMDAVEYALSQGAEPVEHSDEEPADAGADQAGGEPAGEQ